LKTQVPLKPSYAYEGMNAEDVSPLTDFRRANVVLNAQLEHSEVLVLLAVPGDPFNWHFPVRNQFSLGWCQLFRFRTTSPESSHWETPY
jgi:hypothetical protein